MPHTSVLVVGAGQAGLAVSHLLGQAGIEHVVLERGRIADRWAMASWQSLRLLTPNWLSRLPGYAYPGRDQAGFMAAHQVADYLSAYASLSSAPVVEGARVRAVGHRVAGFRVETDAGLWTSDAVVLATGWCDRPHVPAAGSQLSPDILQLTPASYRDPASLPDGGVLVVGAAASGAQIADEIAASGRAVTMAVGRHARVPRRYRGLDIFWWLDAMGVLDRRRSDGDQPALLSEPSMQLAGRSDGVAVDLPSLQERGIRLVGRVTTVEGSKVRFAADVSATAAYEDARLASLLDRIDEYATAAGLDDEIEPSEPQRSIIPPAPVHDLDVRRAGIGSVLWATGYRRDYPWLHLPVLDGRGDVRHHHGTTDVPGLYVVGMRWQTRRNSSFLDGVRHDAEIVVAAIRRQVGALVEAGEEAA